FLVRLAFGDERDLLYPLQRCALLVGESGTFVPCVEEKQTLGILAVAQRFVRMHADAERAAVDLRCAELDQVKQLAIDLRADDLFKQQQVLVSVRGELRQIHSQGFHHGSSLLRPRLCAAEATRKSRLRYTPLNLR